jgi:hypothetical protein
MSRLEAITSASQRLISPAASGRALSMSSPASSRSQTAANEFAIALIVCKLS